MAVELVLVPRSGEQRPFKVSRPRIIGREEDCDFRIPVAEVSREHCRVEPSGGGLAIMDLGSSNGTFVNGQQVEESELGAGDVVKIGPAVFVVRVDGNPASIDAQDAWERAGTAVAAGQSPQQIGGGSQAADDDDLFSDFDFDDDD
ncbi:MAG: FHA domain-containing protein [Planctomycetota bacterium]